MNRLAQAQEFCATFRYAEDLPWVRPVVEEWLPFAELSDDALTASADLHEGLYWALQWCHGGLHTLDYLVLCRSPYAPGRCSTGPTTALAEDFAQLFMQARGSLDAPPTDWALLAASLGVERLDEQLLWQDTDTEDDQ
jgi:hypothetical protein